MPDCQDGSLPEPVTVRRHADAHVQGWYDPSRARVTVRAAISSSLWMAAVVLTVLSGCRSRAKNDLYIQKLNSELRVMEDQLYQADYENRVLAEKLERERNKKIRESSRETSPRRLSRPRTEHAPIAPSDTTFPPPIVSDPSSSEHSAGQAAPPAAASENTEAPNTPSTSDGVLDGADTAPGTFAPPSRFDLADGLNDAESGTEAPPGPSAQDGSTTPYDEADLIDPSELIDPGQPIVPENLPPPDPNTTTDIAGPDSSAITTPPAESKSNDPFRDDGSTFEFPEGILLPPGEPEPPGKRDLEVPDVEPGDILPPPGKDAVPEAPPGRIELPESLRDMSRRGRSMTGPIPKSLSLHQGFSGAHHFGDEQLSERQMPDGMMLVVNVLDKDKRMIDLENLDIVAELTVVALDPTKPGSEARLARWDFDSDEVAGLVRRNPVSGLHIPVVWDETMTPADEVIVHVRLQAGDDRMTCQGKVQTSRITRVAKWLPRGDRKVNSTMSSAPFSPSSR
ncbi:MAG: hypothetical protein AAF989_12470 [Planctomycetota bacterium]